jgi:hypothetical protein
MSAVVLHCNVQLDRWYQHQYSALQPEQYRFSTPAVPVPVRPLPGLLVYRFIWSPLYSHVFNVPVTVEPFAGLASKAKPGKQIHLGLFYFCKMINKEHLLLADNEKKRIYHTLRFFPELKTSRAEAAQLEALMKEKTASKNKSTDSGGKNLIHKPKPAEDEILALSLKLHKLCSSAFNEVIDPYGTVKGNMRFQREQSRKSKISRNPPNNDFSHQLEHSYKESSPSHKGDFSVSGAGKNSEIDKLLSLQSACVKLQSAGFSFSASNGGTNAIEKQSGEYVDYARPSPRIEVFDGLNKVQLTQELKSIGLLPVLGISLYSTQAPLVELVPPQESISRRFTESQKSQLIQTDGTACFGTGSSSQKYHYDDFQPTSPIQTVTATGSSKLRDQAQQKLKQTRILLLKERLEVILGLKMSLAELDALCDVLYDTFDEELRKQRGGILTDKY